MSQTTGLTRMRIAIVTETYPPEINGVALTVQGFVEQLARLGHEVALVRPHQPGAARDPMRLPSVEELLVRGAALPRYPGLRFGMPCAATLRREWRRRRPDAVYIATEGPLGWSAQRAAAALRIPSATGFHTRFDDFAAHYGMGMLAPIVFSCLRAFHNGADATLVPTTELRSFLASAGFRGVRLLPRAVDTQLFHPTRRDSSLRAEWALRPDDLAVIHVGRIAPEKNLGLAIEAFRQIAVVRPGARFILVGDGPARAALERAHPDFHYCGVRRGDDLARHFASADLFLFPSLTETFGNVTLESMASGVPVVAFDYGAARQHVWNGVNGRVVARGDHEAYLDAACELARDAEGRIAMGRRARSAVEALDPAAVAARLAEILVELAPARRRAA